MDWPDVESDSDDSQTIEFEAVDQPDKLVQRKAGARNDLMEKARTSLSSANTADVRRSASSEKLAVDGSEAVQGGDFGFSSTVAVDLAGKNLSPVRKACVMCLFAKPMRP